MSHPINPLMVLESKQNSLLYIIIRHTLSNVTGTFREIGGLNPAILPCLCFSNSNSAESLLPCSVIAGLQFTLMGSHTYIQYIYVQTHADLRELSENNGVWHYLNGLYPQMHTPAHTHTHRKQWESVEPLSFLRVTSLCRCPPTPTSHINKMALSQLWEQLLA